jgi:riboflavin kinase
MRVKGKVVAGVLRGEHLIEKYRPRLLGVLGFEPFPGTLNVRTERKIDLKFYATKTLDHILLDGSRHVEGYLARVKLISRDEEYECWAFRQRPDPHGPYFVEIIAKENLRTKFGLKDGDEVEIEFPDVAQAKKKEGFLSRLVGPETRISR